MMTVCMKMGDLATGVRGDRLGVRAGEHHVEMETETEAMLLQG